jgi:2,3,4,5-tetrahydropyridine-2-carboxylate N-succinyltransferase
VNAPELQSEVTTLLGDPSDVKGKRGRVLDEVIAALDAGRLRVASPSEGGTWTTHAWIKQAILLYFRRADAVWIGDPQREGLAYFDKIPVKKDFDSAGVRCVPGGIVRYGSFLARGVIMMPGFVNIGAYVDEGSMIDTWATVGSCAQIGKNVHLAGGVGIGGVLEPPQAAPVIVEDGAFVGSRCIVVEGVRVGREAVLGAGTVITASTPVIDVRGSAPVVSRGAVPERAIVIPGSQAKRYPAGEYNAPCALIIGTRNESTDQKISLNEALREFEVAL